MIYDNHYPHPALSQPNEFCTLVGLAPSQTRKRGKKRKIDGENKGDVEGGRREGGLMIKEIRKKEGEGSINVVKERKNDRGERDAGEGKKERGKKGGELRMIIEIRGMKRERERKRKELTLKGIKNERRKVGNKEEI